MKILFFTKYDAKGASSRYRTYQFLPCLLENNIEYEVSYLFSSNYLASLYSGSYKKYFIVIFSYIKRFFHFFKFFKYDVIFIEYELFPYFPSTFEHLLKIFRKKYIVDYDDAIFHNYDLNKNPIIRFLLKNKIKKVIKNASAVLVGSEYLYNYAINSNKNVHKIPTVVDLNKYKSVIPKGKNTIFTIGWIGSPSTSYYLLSLMEVFQKIQSQSIRFKFIGADKKVKEKFEGIPIEWIDWNQENEISDIKSFSIGIMPIDDTPWSKGKCGLKLIQYMACGIPVLASNVGENNIIVEQNKNGYLAKNNEEWYDYLIKMYDERNTIGKMGKYGLELAEKNYSLQIASKQLIQILNSSL